MHVARFLPLFAALLIACGPTVINFDPSNAKEIVVRPAAGQNVFCPGTTFQVEVPDGGLCCLMGRNGVGKTTLLQTIVGLQPAKRGSVALGGETITKKAPFSASAESSKLYRQATCLPEVVCGKSRV